MKKYNYKCLLVDDDINLSTVISHQLQGLGYMVTVANSGTEGIDKFKADFFDFALIDLQMPDMNGMEVLNFIRSFDEKIIIIIITAYGTVENAVQACQKGADDYLTKPFAREQLFFTIEKALKFRQLEKENLRLYFELEEKYQFDKIISKNKKMISLLEIAGRAAQSDAGVLITGESGTGKELLARAIHHNSPRKDKSFVTVNCPSIPETLIESELFGHEKGAFTGAFRDKPGKFEIADNGTIFLDEIGDLKPDLQAKLLRVLQEQEFERVGGVKPIKVNVRIIAATNQNLASLVRERTFREDLYYRLNVIPLHIPPLRERKDDIEILTKHFVNKYSDHELKIHPPFLQKLKDYHWPGNIRELENILQRTIILCKDNELREDCLDLQITDKNISSTNTTSPMSLENIERQAIIDALNANNGNQTKAAKQLEIPRHTLIYRMKKLGIS
ncbi:sigma-54-dependent Fis family transcriptional regulator [candidate division KSB1 bacterium]|nr:sigma-54-dependent Fis family transcriptional regulator [candidate division KSB1 bacterium]